MGKLSFENKLCFNKISIKFSLHSWQWLEFFEYRIHYSFFFALLDNFLWVNTIFELHKLQTSFFHFLNNYSYHFLNNYVFFFLLYLYVSQEIYLIIFRENCECMLRENLAIFLKINFTRFNSLMRICMYVFKHSHSRHNWIELYVFRQQLSIRSNQHHTQLSTFIIMHSV